MLLIEQMSARAAPVQQRAPPPQLLKIQRLLEQWVRAMMCSAYVNEGDNVLELLCGRSPEFAPIAEAKPRKYFIVDASTEDIATAQEKWKAFTKKHPSTASIFVKFIALDVARSSLAQRIGITPATPPGSLYSYISLSGACALNLLMGDRRRLVNVFDNAAAALRPGGLLVGTALDTDVLWRRFHTDADADADCGAGAGTAPSATGVGLVTSTREAMRDDEDVAAATATVPQVLSFDGYSVTLHNSKPAVAPADESSAAAAAAARESLFRPFTLKVTFAFSSSSSSSTASATAAAAAASQPRVSLFAAPWSAVCRLAALRGLQLLSFTPLPEFVETNAFSFSSTSGAAAAAVSAGSDDAVAEAARALRDALPPVPSVAAGAEALVLPRRCASLAAWFGVFVFAKVPGTAGAAAAAVAAVASADAAEADAD
jgi:hypothetical protein